MFKLSISTLSLVFICLQVVIGCRDRSDYQLTIQLINKMRSNVSPATQLPLSLGKLVSFIFSKFLAVSFGNYSMRSCRES